jgi:hypothetical protein
MKLSVACILFVTLILAAVPASAVPMRLSATYDTYATINGGPDENIGLTYNAYYNSDRVTTTLGNYSYGMGVQGYTQSVSLDYWEMIYLDQVIVKKSGGNIYYDFSDPTTLNRIMADEGLTTAEMPCDSILDIRSNSSARIGMDLYTGADNTTLGDIRGISGDGILTISEVSVPEPSALYLLLSSFIGLAMMQKKRR